MAEMLLAQLCGKEFAENPECVYTTALVVVKSNRAMPRRLGALFMEGGQSECCSASAGCCGTAASQLAIDGHAAGQWKM